MQARIYKNGNPIGTLRSSSSRIYQTFSEDLSGWEAGDHIQLYVKSDSTWVRGYWENFKIKVGNPITPYKVL